MAAQDLINTKQELIGAIVLRELKNSATLLRFVTDMSNLAVKGADKISVPKLSSFTVGDRALGAAGTETAALADAKDTINLDKNKYLQWGYDAKSDMQSTISYLTESIKRASSAMGRQINADILAAWNGALGAEFVTGVDIVSADILNMREHLIANYADMNTAALIISADQEKAMLKLPEFSRYDYRGGAEAPVVNGMIGSVYGVPVVIFQGLAAFEAFMVTPEGSGFAFQVAPAIAQEDNLDYGTGGKKVVADTLYGVGGLQLGEGEFNAVAAKSPFITKKS
jgi:hypothetical protein|tara:strand:- start:118 stop:966 length:849 start_codon:yes stop_codon:yes gene_type:complete